VVRTGLLFDSCRQQLFLQPLQEILFRSGERRCKRLPPPTATLYDRSRDPIRRHRNYRTRPIPRRSQQRRTQPGRTATR
jgi:hypothetical protein